MAELAEMCEICPIVIRCDVSQDANVSEIYCRRVQPRKTNRSCSASWMRLLRALRP